MPVVFFFFFFLNHDLLLASLGAHTRMEAGGEREHRVKFVHPLLSPRSPDGVPGVADAGVGTWKRRTLCPSKTQRIGMGGVPRPLPHFVPSRSCPWGKCSKYTEMVTSATRLLVTVLVCGEFSLSRQAPRSTAPAPVICGLELFAQTE